MDAGRGSAPGCGLLNGPSGSIGQLPCPWGMAAKVLHPERPVFVFQGDGTFGFHAMEIDTCLRYGLPVVVIVGNDARWNAEVAVADPPVRTGPAPSAATSCRPATTASPRPWAASANGWRLPASWRRRWNGALASGLPAVIDATVDGLPAPVF